MLGAYRGTVYVGTNVAFPACLISPDFADVARSDLLTSILNAFPPCCLPELLSFFAAFAVEFAFLTSFVNCFAQFFLEERFPLVGDLSRGRVSIGSRYSLTCYIG